MTCTRERWRPDMTPSKGAGLPSCQGQEMSGAGCSESGFVRVRRGTRDTPIIGLTWENAGQGMSGFF